MTFDKQFVSVFLKMDDLAIIRAMQDEWGRVIIGIGVNEKLKESELLLEVYKLIVDVVDSITPGAECQEFRIVETFAPQPRRIYEESYVLQT